MVVRLHLADQPAPPRPRLRWLEYALLVCGLIGVDAYIWTTVNTEVGQAYDSWSMDQHLKGRTASLRGFLAERLGMSAIAPENETAQQPEAASRPRRQHLPAFALVGRVDIPRLHLNAMVREGVDNSTLDRAVGHMPSTALPGDPGNVAFAAHRDTLFRKLKGIRKADRITVETTDGRSYEYEVDSLKIVDPSDVSVLEATPGEQSLTLITCYPFNYIGSAPNRFIVRAHQVNETAISSQGPPAQRGS